MKNIATPQKTEQILLADLSQLIEQSKKFVIVQANSVMTMLYWHVGKRINEDILQNRRADYGKQIVAPLAQQLSWSHFRELIPLKTEEARMFYAREAAERGWGKRELRQSIERKEFERTEIANLQIAAPESKIPFNIFKDPYFLDMFNLLYLKWLNRNERQEGENEPIGLLLCEEGHREQIELLEMHRDGIMVAEYCTALPPKQLLEDKVRDIIAETRELFERRKGLNK